MSSSSFQIETCTFAIIHGRLFSFAFVWLIRLCSSKWSIHSMVIHKGPWKKSILDIKIRYYSGYWTSSVLRIFVYCIDRVIKESILLSEYFPLCWIQFMSVERVWVMTLQPYFHMLLWYVRQPTQFPLYSDTPRLYKFALNTHTHTLLCGACCAAGDHLQTQKLVRLSYNQRWGGSFRACYP